MKRKPSIFTSPATRWHSTAPTSSVSPRIPIDQLKSAPANQEVFCGGMLTQVRYMDTKKARNGNTRYVRCKLEDLNGSVECVMWPDDYIRFKEQIEEDRIVFVAATVERTREEPGLVITRVLSIEQGQRERTTGLVLLLNLQIHKPEQIDALANVFSNARAAPSRCFCTCRIPPANGSNSRRAINIASTPRLW